MSSTRLPGKVLLELVEDLTLLQAVVQRAALSQSLDQIVVATTELSVDDRICKYCREELDIPFHRGSSDDVLGRVLGTAREAGADKVVRLTGDCPLVDPVLIDDVVDFYRTGSYDYVSTTHMDHSENWKEPRTFPRGVTVQVLSADLLAEVDRRTADPRDREYVTFFIYDRPEEYRLGAFQAEGMYADWRHPELRFAVDKQEDLELIRRVFGQLYPCNSAFSTVEAIELVAENPDLKAINRQVQQKMVHSLGSES